MTIHITTVPSNLVTEIFFSNIAYLSNYDKISMVSECILTQISGHRFQMPDQRPILRSLNADINIHSRSKLIVCPPPPPLDNLKYIFRKNFSLSCLQIHILKDGSSVHLHFCTCQPLSAQ